MIKEKIAENFLQRVSEIHKDADMIDKADKFYKEASSLTDKDLLKKFTI